MSDFKPTLLFYGYIARNIVYSNVKKYANTCSGVLLDFGCGSKPYKHLFNCKTYIGIDYNGEGHSHKNEQIDVFYDGIVIPYLDNSFDSIFSCEVLEHVYNFKEMVKELNRVLKPGGTFLLICPFSYAEHETPVDYFRYTSFGISKTLKDAGFEIVLQKKLGNAVQTLCQYFLSYISTHITCKLGILGKILISIISLFVNTISVLSKFIPSQELYLDNLVICKKIIKPLHYSIRQKHQTL